MQTLRMIALFFRASAQQELAYRENFALSLFSSLLNLLGGLGGIWVLFTQVEALHGWTFPAALALLGVYLILGALRSLVFGPSLDALTGMDGEVWTGRLDYTLLKPIDFQLIASLRQWRPLALIDLLFGVGVLLAAGLQTGAGFDLLHVPAFLLCLAAAALILYSLLLIFSALVFYSPGFLFTWVFDALYQMARYPVGLYPGALRLLLTWIIPVGLMTTLPAQALTVGVPPLAVLGGWGFALLLFALASLVFRRASRSYSSASS